jgi:hypothetical protein|tara:strand:- start:70 stop:282 length:213 start_codon:yes stop_codon:yes gene_type:complete
MAKIEVGLVVEGALQGHNNCDDVEFIFEVVTEHPADIEKAVGDAMEAARDAWPSADDYYVDYVKEYHSVH